MKRFLKYTTMCSRMKMVVAAKGSIMTNNHLREYEMSGMVHCNKNKSRGVQGDREWTVGSCELCGGHGPQCAAPTHTLRMTT